MKGLTAYAAALLGLSVAGSTMCLAQGKAEQAAPAQQSQPQQQISQKVAPPLSQAHAAATAERWDEAITHLKEAQAVEGRTAFDDYQIDEILGFVLTRKGDYAAAAETYERTVASGLVSAEELPGRLRLLTQLFYETKNYPKAVEYANRILADATGPEPDLHSLVARAQYLSGNHREAIEAVDRAIEDARAAGKPVDETWYQVQLSSYSELRDNAGILTSLERLATEFPKKKYWDDLLRLMKRQPDLDSRAQTSLYRLMYDTGALQSPEDYVQAARNAMRVGLPGEALLVLQQAKERKVFTGEDNVERERQLTAEAQKAAQLDKKSLGALETEARAAKSGEADVQLGIAFMSYGDYAKAVEAIERGRKKGGLKNAGEADLMLGRALFKLDRASEARAAFERVAAGGKPGDKLHSQLGSLAKLWMVYMRNPSAVST